MSSPPSSPARPRGQRGPAAPRARLAATALVGLVRSVTSPEVLAEVERHRTAAAQRTALRGWVATAAPMLSSLDNGRATDS